MPRTCLITGLMACLALSACAGNDPRPIAIDPGEPIPRLAAFDQLMAINDANAQRFGMTVAELRTRDLVCVMLATGVEIRPGIIVDYDEAMLSATLEPEDYLDVRVNTISEDAGVYASQGCKLMALAWDDDADSGAAFRNEQAARRYLDKFATAWTTLGGTLQRRVRHAAGGAE